MSPAFCCSSAVSSVTGACAAAAVADAVDRHGRLGEHGGKPERHRGHERAETDDVGGSRQRGEQRPRVGRSAVTVAVAHHAEVVVGGEDGLEAQPLRGPRGREPIGPRDAFLSLEHQAEAHRRVA